MQTVTVLVNCSAFIASTYYIITALMDYFNYGTVTSISFRQQQPFRDVVICVPNASSLDNLNYTDYSYVKSFLGNYRVCLKIKLEKRTAFVSYQIIQEMKVYVAKYSDVKPWNLSRLNLIYGSYPDVVNVSTELDVYVTFTKLESQLMPAPYDTNCHQYDQYKCIFDCSQVLAQLDACLQACSRPGCAFMQTITLAHTSMEVNTSSKMVIEQDNQVQSTVFDPKIDLGFIVLNTLGLLGVFFGFSLLSVASVTWRLFSAKLKLVKKISIMACSICALYQCCMVVSAHLKYGQSTEVYQGLTHIHLPKLHFSICGNMKLTNESWSKIQKPPMTKLMEQLWIRRYDAPEILFILEDALAEFENVTVTTYSVRGKLCHLMSLPERRIGPYWVDQRSEILKPIDLSIESFNMEGLYEVWVHGNAYDIMQEDVGIMTLLQATFQNTYLETISLPHPYKTSCQTYGRGHLENFKSRSQCINACALKHFRKRHPGLHPTNIPIFNSSDSSHIAGNAEEYLESCRRLNCRWTACEKRRFKLYTVQQANWEDKIKIMTVNTPKHNVFKLRDVPLTMVTDTLLILISEIGFWAGINMWQVLGRAKTLLRVVRARKSHRKAFKATRSILLTIGIIFNLNAAFQKYFAYETLTQSFTQVASSYSPVNPVLIQGVEETMECLGYSKCSNAELTDLAANCSKQSHALISAIWNREYETMSWSKMPLSLQSQLIKTHVHSFSYLITELQTSRFSVVQNPEKLIASGSTAILKIDLFTDVRIDVLVVNSFDNFDMSMMISGITETYPGKHTVFDFEGIAVSLLSAPYIFDCIDYATQGYKNQKRCYDICMEARFFKVFGLMNAELRPISIEKLTQAVGVADVKNSTNFAFDTKNAFACQRLCSKPDCHSNILSTKQSSLKKPDNKTTLEINAQAHETVIKHVPKMIWVAMGTEQRSMLQLAEHIISSGTSVSPRMQKSKTLVFCIALIGASYYISMALADYFNYATTTSLVVETETPSSYIVICVRSSMELSHTFPFASENVSSFSGSYSQCLKVTLKHGGALVSPDVLRDMKVYALESPVFKKSDLSRHSSIYESYIYISNNYYGMNARIHYKKVRRKLLPAPYKTDCHKYDQYECIYNCTITGQDIHYCLTRCSKQACNSWLVSVLDHVSFAARSILPAIFVNQLDQVLSTTVNAKLDLGFIVINTFGLLGAFFGLSVLSLAMSLRLALTPTRPVVGKVFQLVVYAIAMRHCWSIAHDHFKYRSTTEVYQGREMVALPVPSYSACMLTVVSDDIPWANLTRDLPPLEALVHNIVLRRDTQFVLLRANAINDYEPEFLNTYSIHHQLCFYFRQPSRILENEKSFKFTPGFPEISLSLQFKRPTAVVVAVHVESQNIMGDKVKLMTYAVSVYQNTYTETHLLPHPFSSECQTYGQGLLSDFGSRDDCVSACALSKFKLQNPDQHPIDIPLMNTSDTAYIRGVAEPYLELCRETKCRWKDCIRGKFQLYKVEEATTGIFHESWSEMEPEESSQLRTARWILPDQPREEEPSSGFLSSVLQYERNNMLYNWSEKLVFMDGKMGEMNASGHFDGMLGSLQHNDVDLIFHLIIQELFVHDVIVHGPVFMPLELVITQARQESKFRNIDVADSLGIMIATSAWQLLPGLIVAALVISFSHLAIVGHRYRKFWQSVFISLRRFCRRCLCSMMGQDNDTYAISSQRLAWIFVSASLFVTISGYVLNQLSTDAVVLVEPKYAERIEDLLGNNGTLYDVHIDEEMYFYPKLKKETPSSNLGRLYRQIGRQQVCPEPRTCNMAPLAEMTNYVIDSAMRRDARYIALWEKRYIRNQLRCLYPYLRNAMSEKHMRIGQVPIAEALGIIALSKGLPDAVIRYLSMRWSFVLEFGLQGKLYEDFTLALAKNNLPGFRD
ncbi:hypothetical protein HDE_03615 [Halotydeus destructor]|nr:hypothetical protein HDE_03615 [Halotydeus destructor]